MLFMISTIGDTAAMLLQLIFFATDRGNDHMAEFETTIKKLEFTTTIDIVVK